MTYLMVLSLVKVSPVAHSIPNIAHISPAAASDTSYIKARVDNDTESV